MVVIDREGFPGPWQTLFWKAMDILASAAEGYGLTPPLTFGGGTVLMLRHGHRESRDIDLFVNDTFFLSFASPRLNDKIEAGDYVETSSSLKLVFEEGEVDLVAAPNLLTPALAYERWRVLDYEIEVETAAEIVAKKMFHRGAIATPRDLFDLAMVVEREPHCLNAAREFLIPHRDVFLSKISQPNALFAEKFAAIVTLNYTPSLEHAVTVATRFLSDL